MKSRRRVNIPMRLVLDTTRCDGHGICSLRCPERLSIDEWGYAVVDSEAIIQRGSFVRAQRAIRACPEGALTMRTIVEAPESATTPLVD